jgi:hypothetical protein
MLATDAAVFLDPADFGETITYRQYTAPATFTNKAINAQVFRGVQVDAVRIGGQPLDAKIIEVQVARDATLGIATVKPGLDRVQLKAKLSDSGNTEFQVVQLLEHDPGVWRLECHGGVAV